MRQPRVIYTEEQLYEREDALIEKENQDLPYPLFHKWIELYEDFFTLYRSDDHFKDEKEAVRKKLVRYLLEYGLYLKSSLKKEHQLAASQLQKVLKYDKNNPVALYRLGFLHYRENAFHESIRYFNDSLDQSQTHDKQQWPLNDRQSELASLYLLSSMIHLRDQLNPGNSLTDDSGVEGYELATDIEDVISRKEYRAFTKKREWLCNYESCLDEFNQALGTDLLVLFFDLESTFVQYRHNRVQIHIDYARLLKILMEESYPHQPLGAEEIPHIFPKHVDNNTNIQKAGRVRRFLRTQLGIEDVILPGGKSGTYTRYYFNDTYDCLILSRSDF
ncbi:tetratricopeptide repeat protein [Salisediminibacterium beveridgei]|nr:hypothetical protein [Salisediminibacterium beveridgei]